MWRTKQHPRIPPRAFASWHVLEELSLCLHFVQAYIEDLPAPGSTQNASNASQRNPEVTNSRKRKAPGLETAARDSASKIGLLTPVPSHLSDSRSPSLSSADDAAQANPARDWWDVQVYNGILQRREGWIVAKKAIESQPFQSTYSAHYQTGYSHRSDDHQHWAPADQGDARPRLYNTGTHFRCRGNDPPSLHGETTGRPESVP